MKKLLSVIGISLLAAAVSAAEIKPAMSWRFDRPDLFDIVPEDGKVLGHLHTNSRYDFVDGFSGKALQLGRTVKIGGVWFSPFTVDLTGPFTISIKLKLTPEIFSPKGFRKYREIWGNCQAVGPGIRLSIYKGNIIFWTGDGLRGQNIKISNSRFRIPIEKWFQIVVVHDGSKVTLYADGRPYVSHAMKLTASPKPFNVGSMLGLRNPLTGLVDDLEIYDVALNAQQVRDITLKK